MSRLRDFGRDVAYYFGVGQGSPRRDQDEVSDPAEVLVEVSVRVVPVLVAAFVLDSLLELDANRFLLILGLGVVLSVVWSLALAAVGRYRSGRRNHRSGSD